MIPVSGRQPRSYSGSRRRAARRSIGFLLVLAAVALAAAFSIDDETVLRWVADKWIVSDALAPADVVAVFGGGLKDRPAAAATYYREGLVKRVVISNVRRDPEDDSDGLPAHVEANRRILLGMGVPSTSIETFGKNLTSTHDEALALEAWAAQAHVRSIIVPTEMFSTRRVRWTLARVFGGAVEIRVTAIEDQTEYRRDNWWRHRVGLVEFGREFIKSVLYWILY